MSISKQIEAIDTKIAALTTKRAELVAKQGLEVDVETLVPGVTQITFVTGKADAKRALTGIFLGSKRAEKGGTVVKAQVGTGIDTEIIGLFPSQIVSVA
jgi:hypothetical protein